MSSTLSNDRKIARWLIVAHSHNLQANSDASVEVLARAAGEANSAHRRGAIDHCWERISRRTTRSRPAGARRVGYAMRSRLAPSAFVSADRRPSTVTGRSHTNTFSPFKSP